MKAEETIWLVCQVRWGGFEAGVGSYVVMLLKGCNRERGRREMCPEIVATTQESNNGGSGGHGSKHLTARPTSKTGGFCVLSPSSPGEHQLLFALLPLRPHLPPPWPPASSVWLSPNITQRVGQVVDREIGKIGGPGFGKYGSRTRDEV